MAEVSSSEESISSSVGSASISTKSEAEDYLHSLINKTLRVYTTDSRLFVGTFKCTDPVSSPSQSFCFLASTVLERIATCGTDTPTE
jgi:hypothetical protein